MTESGIGPIKPTGGGYFDESGKYIPEMFPPDPYRLTDPASALAHYVGGSGEDRNYYMNSVDTRAVKLSDFPKIKNDLDAGKPGAYEYSDVPITTFDSGRPFDPHKLSAAATVGRLGMKADGILIIDDGGRYEFNGVLGVDHEEYTFPAESGRSPLTDASTWIGRQLSGKPYRVHIIGTQPLSESGHLRTGR